MKKNIIILFALLLLTIPYNANAYTNKELSEACGTDSFSVGLAERNEGQAGADRVFGQINTLLRASGQFNRDYSTAELKAFYLKGAKILGNQHMLYQYVASGAGLDEKQTDQFCNSIRLAMIEEEKKADEAVSIVLYPKDALLEFSSGVIVEPHYAPYNLGGWRSGVPVIFGLNLEKAGIYEVSLNYSKPERDGTGKYLHIYGFNDLNNMNLSNKKPLEAILQRTGNDWSNYVYASLGEIALDKGQIYLYLRSKTPEMDKYTMNLRDIRLKFVREK